MLGLFLQYMLCSLLAAGHAFYFSGNSKLAEASLVNLLLTCSVWIELLMVNVWVNDVVNECAS